jgi:hypothetical protein
MALGIGPNRRIKAPQCKNWNESEPVFRNQDKEWMWTGGQTIQHMAIRATFLNTRMIKIINLILFQTVRRGFIFLGIQGIYRKLSQRMYMDKAMPKCLVCKGKVKSRRTLTIFGRTIGTTAIKKNVTNQHSTPSIQTRSSCRGAWNLTSSWSRAMTLSNSCKHRRTLTGQVTRRHHRGR